MRAVLQNGQAVHGKRDGCPLVLLNPAIVVRLEERQLVLFIERMGLEVQTRGVDVRRCNADTVLAAVFADHSQNQCLAPVVVIHLVPGLIGLFGIKRHKALFFRAQNSGLHRLALGLAVVQKYLIILAEGIRLLYAIIGELLVSIFAADQQFLAELLHIHLFLFLSHEMFLLFHQIHRVPCMFDNSAAQRLHTVPSPDRECGSAPRRPRKCWDRLANGSPSPCPHYRH